MRDKTDPRLEVPWNRGDFDDLSGPDILAAFDAADRAAGIVRVDTNNEALVERLVEARWRKTWRYGCRLSEADEASGRRLVANEVRATLAALLDVAGDDQ